MIFWNAVCAMLGLGFAAEAMGLFTHELNAGFAVLFLVAAATLDPTMRRGGFTAPDRKATRRNAILAGVGLLLLPSPIALRFFGLAVWFWSLDGIARARSGQRSPAAAFAIGSLLTGLFLLCSRGSLLCWYAINNWSLELSEGIAQWSGQPLIAGPTFVNPAILVLALGCCLGSLLFHMSPRRVITSLLAVFAIVGLFRAYLYIFAVMPLALPTAVLETGTTDASFWQPWIETIVKMVYPVHAPMLLPLLLAFPVGFYAWGLKKAPVPKPVRPARLSLILIALLAVIAVWAHTNMPGKLRTPQPNAAIYEKGFLNWSVPTHKRYGSRSGGMFGNMPLLLQRMGWQADLIPDITVDALAERDVLVIINQKDALPAESKAAIDGYLQAGGSLLVLGDHTFWKSEKRLLVNEPIESSHIRLRFDSADYFIGGWLHSLQYWPHQITAGLGDAINEAGSVVGASLEIQYPATPLVIGRYGYSDPGKPEATRRGYLGNLDYDPGEMLGDTVLVAAENVGDGRVVVVGDTSGFVNGIQTQTWPYVQRVFHWLASTGQASVPKWRDQLGIALLVLVFLLVLYRVRSNTRTLPLVAASLWIAGFGSHTILTSINRPAPLRGDVAVVDLSHVGLHSMEGWRNNGISGIYLNLMREGFLALGARDFDAEQILAADLFITIVPTQPYSSGELRVLKEFMEQGGTLILAAGSEDKSGAVSLLEMADIDIEYCPLGRSAINHAESQTFLTFWSAWPVRGGEPIVSLSGKPVIVKKPFGKGRLVVVGDSDFFLNKNLESENGAVVPHVQFFGWLLNHVMERETP